MTDGSMRASDAERESVVTALRDAYTEGRLTLDEFTDRTAAAYEGRTWDDLRGLTTDLPVQPRLGTGELVVPGGETESKPAPAEDSALSQPRHAQVERPARRKRPMGILLPVVLLWAIIAAANSNPSAAAALSVLFICLLTVRIANSGRW
jgi:Domain of unknown function (DUF1707)